MGVKVGLAIIGVIILLIWWWRAREWYRLFQKRYEVKLPRLCWVSVDRRPDMIMWGFKRYRFIRKDGGRDRRRALNFKVNYPTQIRVHNLCARIWDMDEAKRVFYEVQDFMKLRLEDVPFWGNIDKDLWELFYGRPLLFVRHVAKIFAVHGWQTELQYNNSCDAIIQHENSSYLLACFFQQEPVTVAKLRTIPRISPVLKWIVATNSSFTDRAQSYAKERKMLLMDKERMDLTFKVGFIMFIGRQG